MPINSCCAVGLETNLDSEKELRDRQMIKDEILSDAAEDRMRRGLPPLIREVVKIYSSNLQGTTGGSFLLEDFPYEDPQLLAGNFNSAVQGNGEIHFRITNIAYISDELASKYGWKARPLALWSGNVKIIPIVSDGLNREPGIMRLVTATGSKQGEIIDKIDKSLLDAEIIDYTLLPLEVSAANPQVSATSGQVFHVITLRKQFPEDLIG